MFAFAHMELYTQIDYQRDVTLLPHNPPNSHNLPIPLCHQPYLCSSLWWAIFYCYYSSLIVQQYRVPRAMMPSFVLDANRLGGW